MIVARMYCAMGGVLLPEILLMSRRVV